MVRIYSKHHRNRLDCAKTIMPQSDSESEDDSGLGNFKPIRKFSHSIRVIDIVSKASPPTVKFTIPKTLGDFNDLIQSLRQGGDFSDPSFLPKQNAEEQSLAPIPHAKHSSSKSNISDSALNSTSSTGDYTTPTSSPEDLAETIRNFKQRCKGKGVQWTESVAGGSESEGEVDIKSSHSMRSTGNFDLLPSSIIAPPSIKNTRPNRLDIQPKYTLTVEEKQTKLVQKLARKFPDEPAIHRATSLITDLKANSSYRGIHIFIDLSNIVIGFYNQIKFERGIHKASYIRQPPLSFHSLAMVLERGRTVAKRVLAGSTITKEGDDPVIPSYVREAERCGYELNILERVRKAKEPKPLRSNKKGSGYSSASDSAGAWKLSNTEQAVDEILHLKMMESIVDNSGQPSTMVVASGDAAQAEYSGGFFAMILRALNKGWNVEVVSWRDNLSLEYVSPGFCKSWKDQFKVILLDDYCEEMLAIYTEKYLMKVG